MNLFSPRFLLLTVLVAAAVANTDSAPTADQDTATSSITATTLERSGLFRIWMPVTPLKDHGELLLNGREKRSYPEYQGFLDTFRRGATFIHVSTFCNPTNYTATGPIGEVAELLLENLSPKWHWFHSLNCTTADGTGGFAKVYIDTDEHPDYRDNKKRSADPDPVAVTKQDEDGPRGPRGPRPPVDERSQRAPMSRLHRRSETYQSTYEKSWERVLLTRCLYHDEMEADLARVRDPRWVLLKILPCDHEWYHDPSTIDNPRYVKIFVNRHLYHLPYGWSQQRYEEYEERRRIEMEERERKKEEERKRKEEQRIFIEEVLQWPEDLG